MSEMTKLDMLEADGREAEGMLTAVGTAMYSADMPEAVGVIENAVYAVSHLAAMLREAQSRIAELEADSKPKEDAQ